MTQDQQVNKTTANPPSEEIDGAFYNACATVIAAERAMKRADVTRNEVAEFWASVCEARRLRDNIKAAGPKGPAATR